MKYSISVRHNDMIGDINSYVEFESDSLKETLEYWDRINEWQEMFIDEHNRLVKAFSSTCKIKKEEDMFEVATEDYFCTTWSLVRLNIDLNSEEIEVVKKDKNYDIRLKC